MLVLSRKNRESVLVGGVTGFERVLTVTVLEIRGTRVKLGFDVDASVPVRRADVPRDVTGLQPAERTQTTAPGPEPRAAEDVKQ